MNRLQALNKQFGGGKTKISEVKITVDGHSYPEIIDHHADTSTKIDYFNKVGWGYADSGFEIVKDLQQIRVKGNRYMFGGQILPKFLSYFQEHLHLDPTAEDPAQDDMEVA